MSIEYAYDYGEILREDLPSTMQKDLDRFENDAGVLWDKSGGRGSETNSSCILWGITIDGDGIHYVEEKGGGRYVWIGNRKYTPSQALHILGSIFNQRMRYVKHRGDELKEAGVDMEGLEYKDMHGMEKLLREIGVCIPIEAHTNEKLTRVEKEDLLRQWRNFAPWGSLGG